MRIRLVSLFRLSIAALLLFALGNPASALDSDGDLVLDAVDNCLLEGNPDQRDTDADGFGNACDGDFNNNLFVSTPDLVRFRMMLFDRAGALVRTKTYFLGVNRFVNSIGRPKYDRIRRIVFKTPAADGG